MEAGIKTTNIASSDLVDELLGNYQGNTVRIGASSLAALLSSMSGAEVVSEFSPPWGKTASSSIDGAQYKAASSGIDPVIAISSSYAATGPLALDFAGAAGGSAPVGLYVQHEQTGGAPDNNAFTHSIMAYALNAASGDNDVIAVSGRARKKNVSGGIGDAAGIWGSAYQESTENGGVMGGEVHIYQNVAGQLPSDELGPKWSTGLHVRSSSTGSPAHSGVNIDGAGKISGRFGYWNALVIEGNCFHGAGIDGTVGLNCGSWGVNHHPQYGIRFGEAGRHIYGTGDLRIGAAEGSRVQVVHDLDGGAATFQVLSSAGYNAAIDLVNDGSLVGQFYYDQVSANVRVGAAGDRDLQFRTVETYRGAFTRLGEFLVAKSAFGSGFGFAFSKDGYARWDRNSATASAGVLDIFSNVGGTSVNVFRIRSDGSLFMPNIPTSPDGLPVGTVYRSGTSLMIV